MKQRHGMTDIEYLNECNTRDVALMLMEDKGMTLVEALDVIFMSDTYAKMQNPDTGLYFQSPVYVYGLLQTEMNMERGVKE